MTSPGAAAGRSPAVRAVIFDWGGTLTPWHDVDPVQIWAEYALAYLDLPVPASAGELPVPASELAARLHRAEEAAWRAGRDEHTAATLDRIVRSAGVDPTATTHPGALTAFERAWEPHTRADPDALPLLSALRQRGLRVGVLSNTVWPREQHDRVFARDGLSAYLDGAVYSSELAHVKPHPAAFRAALDAVGVDDPRTAVFVGDRLYDDVYGAGQLGMRTIWVPHSTIPEHQRGPAQGQPDAVVQRLADVLDVVDGWLAAGSAGSFGQPGEGDRVP